MYEKHISVSLEAYHSLYAHGVNVTVKRGAYVYLRMCDAGCD